MARLHRSWPGSLAQVTAKRRAVRRLRQHALNRRTLRAQCLGDAVGINGNSMGCWENGWTFVGYSGEIYGRFMKFMGHFMKFMGDFMGNQENGLKKWEHGREIDGRSMRNSGDSQSSLVLSLVVIHLANHSERDFFGELETRKL